LIIYPAFLFTAPTRVSITVWDLSRISCIRTISYRFTICKKTDTHYISRLYSTHQV